MVTTGAIIFGDQERHLAFNDTEHPVALQLGGSNPEELAKSCQIAERYGYDEQGNKRKNYYTAESVGIATGFLINALHEAGLATLTHTPNPMKFLNEILERPGNERPYILLVVGHAADDAMVPRAATVKKPLETISTFL